MHAETPRKNEDDMVKVGEIWRDNDDPHAVIIITQYKSWKVNGYILQSILDNHMQGVKNDDVDAPNPFEGECNDEDWEKRKNRSRHFRKS